MDDSFEKLRFDPFAQNRNLFAGDPNDPDINYFDGQYFQNLNAPYYNLADAKVNLNKSKNKFSIIHVNLRSMKKNFEEFRDLLAELQFSFSMICITETWLANSSFESDSSMHLANYKSYHYERKTGKKGGGVCVFMHETLKYKIRANLSVSRAANETLVIEIDQKKEKNILISVNYRPPGSNIAAYTAYLENFFIDITKEDKRTIFLGDFNLDCLKYSENSSVESFYNTLLSHGQVPLINKATRVTETTQTGIDNIFTNCFFEENLNSGIIKTDISDHFPIFVVMSIENSKPTKKVVTQRKITNQSIENFKLALSNVNWATTVNVECPNNAYDTFINNFSKLYNSNFPLEKKIIRVKDLMHPWMTKGLRKSSKRKQKLWDKFLKKRTSINKKTHDEYKNMFEKLKRKSKILYFSNKLKDAQGCVKRTWDIMKEITGKGKLKSKSLPEKITVDNTKIESKEKIAKQFNNFFINIGPNLAGKIPIGPKD